MFYLYKMNKITVSYSGVRITGYKHLIISCLLTDIAGDCDARHRRIHTDNR